MQRHIGECIYIPYWDSERDAGREWASHIFQPETFGTWGGVRNVGGRQCTADGLFSSLTSPFQSSMSELGQACLERAFVEQWNFSGEAEVLALITNYAQYADTVPGRQQGMNGFRLDFEIGPHLMVHAIVGGQMDSFFSVSDPLFYLHHSNVDRLWAMWQDYWGHDELDKERYSHPWHYDGNLDEEMPFASVRQLSHDFRMQYDDGSWNYPTVRELISMDSSVMSIRYMNDRLVSMIPQYSPNPRWFEASSRADIPVRCIRNGRRELQEKDEDSGLEKVIRHDSLRGPMKHNNAESFLADNNKPATCQQINTFTLREDREEWDRLCRELPEDTPVAERFALLAEHNCERRGNPRKDQIPSKMGAMMRISNHTRPEAFECFHRPDVV